MQAPTTTPTLTLTQDMIDEAMARAEKVACSPDDDRCYPFRSTLNGARESCTPKGRCRVGWISAESGRKNWHVWLDLHTGEGRLRRWVD